MTLEQAIQDRQERIAVLSAEIEMLEQAKKLTSGQPVAASRPGPRYKLAGLLEAVEETIATFNGSEFSLNRLIAGLRQTNPRIATLITDKNARASLSGTLSYLIKAALQQLNMNIETMNNNLVAVYQQEQQRNNI